MLEVDICIENDYLSQIS